MSVTLPSATLTRAAQGRAPSKISNAITWLRGKVENGRKSQSTVTDANTNRKSNSQIDKPSAKLCEVLKEWKQAEPPIPLQDILRWNKVRLVYQTFEGEEKELCAKSCRPVSTATANEACPSVSTIIANEESSPKERAFGIAYELARMIWQEPIQEEKLSYPRRDLRDFPNISGKDYDEMANDFAARLLVPIKALRYYGRVATVTELSDLFIVPETVIRWRLKQEGITPQYTLQVA